MKTVLFVYRLLTTQLAAVNDIEGVSHLSDTSIESTALLQGFYTVICALRRGHMERVNAMHTINKATFGESRDDSAGRCCEPTLRQRPRDITATRRRHHEWAGAGIVALELVAQELDPLGA